MHVGGRAGGRLFLPRLQQRQEGRDPHTGSHPHLGAVGGALAVKAPIGAFDVHRLPHAQPLVQGARVVAQGLDHQAHELLPLEAAAQGVRRTGNGEGMGAFGLVKAHKGELPRTVARPAGRQGAHHLDGGLRALLAQQLYRLDACSMAARAPHPARQGPQCCAAAHSHQSTHELAQRLGPISQGHQGHRVEHQRQKQHRHGTVQQAPVLVVQQARQEREGDHGQQQVKSPLPQVLGEVARIGQPGQHGVARRLAATAPQRLENVPRLLGTPVEHGGQRCGNPGPLVQAVHLVHAAERPLHPGQAQRQQHGQHHQAHAPQATEVNHLLAGRPPGSAPTHGTCRRHQASPRRGQCPPCQGDAQQPETQDQFDPHTMFPFLLQAIVGNTA